MLVRLLTFLIFVCLLSACNSDKGSVSSGNSVTPDLSFDNRPVSLTTFVAPFYEDLPSDWIYLPYTDVENHVATSCEIINRVNVNISSPCACDFGLCRVKLKGFDNYSGAASFQFSVTANGQTSLGVAVPLFILDSPDIPVASPLTISILEDQPYISNGGTFPELQGTDADGDSLTCFSDANPTSGVLVVNSVDCSFTYTPNADFFGTDSFTYKVFDGTYLSSPATVSITVLSQNDAPVTSDLSVTAYQNTALLIDLPASDVDTSDTLTYSVVSGSSDGSLSVVSGSEVTYTPDPDFIGSDSFTFRVTDGVSFSNTSTITITVLPPTVYLRADGDDLTGEINNPNLPFLTTQGAVDAVIAFGPTPTTPVTIDVGVGSFGDVTLNQDFGEDVSWVGVSSLLSEVGRFYSNGTHGSDADGIFIIGDGMPGQNGSNLAILSDFNIQFGDIESLGGNGGMPSDMFSVPGDPGTGGTVILEGLFNRIRADGGRGNAGGEGGRVVLKENSFAEYIEASGGADLCLPAVCTTTRAAGRGGSVTIEDGAMVNQYINAVGGESKQVTSSGDGGDVTVSGRVLGDIKVSGTTTLLEHSPGNGGSITLSGVAEVSGDLFADGGNSLFPGPGGPINGGDGGNITITTGATYGSTDYAEGTSITGVSGAAGTLTILP